MAAHTDDSNLQGWGARAIVQLVDGAADGARVLGATGACEAVAGAIQSESADDHLRRLCTFALVELAVGHADNMARFIAVAKTSAVVSAAVAAHFTAVCSVVPEDMRT
jgi:hypothetical protein